jgi:hypothetical protein
MKLHMQNKVFICHSSLDHPFVEMLSSRLKQDGIDVWIDDWMINVGDSIIQKINEALEASSYFIIVLTENSINSDWVKKELNATLMKQIVKKDVKILPLLLGINVEQLPPLLIDIYSTIFEKDTLNEKEYSKLIKPINETSRGEMLKQYQDAFFETVEHIDIILKKAKPTKHEIEFVLKVINEQQYYDYFFRKVNTFVWFDILKQEGYFNPDLVPGPKEVKDGYYVIPSWNVLPYLEKLSQLVKEPGNEKYTTELLDIIKDVNDYHLKNKLKIDNYRIWWFFVKILLNISNDKIVKYLKDNNIQIGKDWIKEWITSRFDNMLPASDIVNKLLPKFLSDNNKDIEIAEQIIDVTTEIKEDFFEGEEGIKEIVLFKKKKEPKTKVDSYWLIESFRKNADKIGKLCSDTLIFSLADKLKRILDKEHDDHQVLIEIRDKTYRISAKRNDEFNFNFSIDRLYKEEIEALKPEDRYFGVLKVSGETVHSFSKTDIRDKEGFVRIVKQEIESSSSISILKGYIELDKKLNNLYEGLYSDYSSIWYKSLSKSPDTGIHNAEELLVFILKDILISKCAADAVKAKAILEKLLSDEYQYPIFRRLVLLIIGSHWIKYKDLFWHFIEIVPEPFDGSDYEIELFKLLQQNVAQFTSDEKEKIKNFISKGPRWLPDEQERQGQYIARWKQKWFSAMQVDAYFLKFFEEQKSITGEKKIEPPSEEDFVQVRWGEGSSPLTKEDILKMNNADLAKYLKEFKTKDSWKGPTESGLAEVLKAAVKENPDKFIDELHLFSDVKYRYVYNIFYGLQDAWKEKKSLDWGKLFTFAKKYIENSDFFEKAKESQGEDWLVDHVWIINIMADLIQGGTRDDSWAFPEDYFLQAEEILDILITKLPVEYKQESMKDAVTYALNTSYGRVIEAMILFALRKARVADKKSIKKEVRWDPDKYENLLQKGVIEAFTFFGWYIPNFAYLNKIWVEKKIKDFESLEVEDLKWQSFMAGYLSGHMVYQDLYKLMRKHYIKGIESNFPKERAENKLVQHITIGYLRGNESLEGQDSLFKRIIDKWNYSQINEIIDFFWSQARYLKEEVKEENAEDKRVKDRIIEFWRWVYANMDIIKNKLKDDYRRLLSDFSRLTVLLERIDSESSQWLMFSAPFAGDEHNSAFFLEYLDKFNDQESIKHISKIFVEMLTTYTPWYKEENIISIVEKIYNSGNKSDADKICNIYGSRGHEFLRPIYEKYNKTPNK